MNTEWKLMGVGLAILVGLVSALFWFYQQFGGCLVGSNFVCNSILPGSTAIVFLGSVVLFFLSLASFAVKTVDIKQAVLVYLAVILSLIVLIPISSFLLTDTELDCILSDQTGGTCVSALAQKRNDLALCDRVSSSVNRDFCLSYFAIQRNDLTLCQGRAVYECLPAIAKNTKNITLCERIPDSTLGTAPDYSRVECRKTVSREMSR